MYILLKLFPCLRFWSYNTLHWNYLKILPILLLPCSSDPSNLNPLYVYRAWWHPWGSVLTFHLVCLTQGISLFIPAYDRLTGLWASRIILSLSLSLQNPWDYSHVLWLAALHGSWGLISGSQLYDKNLIHQAPDPALIHFINGNRDWVLGKNYITELHLQH